MTKRWSEEGGKGEHFHCCELKRTMNNLPGLHISAKILDKVSLAGVAVLVICDAI